MDRTAEPKKQDAICEGKVDIKKWADEIMDIDSTMLNAKIHIISNIDTIIKYLGKPNNIQYMKPSSYLSLLFNHKRVDKCFVLYYENIVFQGEGRESLLNYIDFDGKMYIKCGAMELRKNLFIGEIIRSFPESGKLIIDSGNAWSGHIELRVSKKPIYEDLRWFLVFENGLLIRVELHRFFQ